LQRHGIEIQQSDEAFSMLTNWPPQKPADPKKADAAKADDKKSDDKKPDANASAKASDKKPEPVKFAKGSYIIRMDQPYSRLADTLLDVQYVRGEEKVYDDTGWTLGLLKNVEVKRVANPDILNVNMHPYTVPEKREAPALPFTYYADSDLARLRFSNKDAQLFVADEEFTSGKVKFSKGTIFERDAFPKVEAHPLRAPRIALMHTWISTQDEGWWRLALESMGVPYDYISTQNITRVSDLRAVYDVIIFPPVGSGRASAQDIVNGYASGPPLPWRKTELTPNIGVDETADMRPGLGLIGVARLQKFVEEGGLLITARDTSVWAIEYGLARWVRVVDTNKLKAPGTIVQGTVTDKKHPIAHGYDDSLPLYFSGSPVFSVGFRDERTPPDSRPSGRGGKDDPDVVQGRPFIPMPERPKPEPGEAGFQMPEDAPWSMEAYMPGVDERPKVVISFAEKDLLLSGMLEGGEEIAGKPAVIDVPRGKGHIILMSTNPMWRMNTSGLYALVMNAVMEMAPESKTR
jgi:hypothetical protein